MANKKDKVKNNKTFFKDFKAELKRVTWPTPKQVMNNTIGVVIIVIIVAVIVFALDLAFESINKYGINKLKGVVENTSISADNTVNDTNNEVSENVTSNETENQVDSTDNTVANETNNEVNSTTNEAANTTNNTEQ